MKKILIFSLCLLSVVGMYAVTAKDAFVSAPRTVLPLLDKNTRLDMLDYYQAGLKNSTKNALEGASRITELDPERIVLQMTDASTVEIDLLPANGKNIYAVISTVRTPAPNSTIAFYDEGWQLLDGKKIFTAPDITNFLTDKSHEADVTMLVPFLMAGYTYSPADKTLTVTNNSESFLGKDMFSQISAWMLPRLVYRWDGKQFKKQ